MTWQIAKDILDKMNKYLTKVRPIYLTTDILIINNLLRLDNKPPSLIELFLSIFIKLTSALTRQADRMTRHRMRDEDDEYSYHNEYSTPEWVY
jgi:hypothetical protein